MHGNRLSSRNFCCANGERTRGIKCMKNIIQDLEHYGPAGLIHIIVLSSIIGKSIKIWNYDGSLNRIIGKETKECPVDVEYHPTDSEYTQIGHWTLRHGKDPDNTTFDLNSCLYSVIGSQTGQDPSKLRKQLISKLKHNLQKLAHQMDEIIPLKGNDGILLMIGGARYNGQSPRDAARILDNSQNVYCHECRHPGHPRGHASDPYASGPNDSVENYARTTHQEKSGFLSRNDQNLVAHLALISQQARNAMNYLNRLYPMATERIAAETLLLAPQICTLPQASWYDTNGNPIGQPNNFRNVVLVMRHHEGQFRNPEADVFVLTFYPVI